jgi:hypothetical protein
MTETSNSKSDSDSSKNTPLPAPSKNPKLNEVKPSSSDKRSYRRLDSADFSENSKD